MAASHLQCRECKSEYPLEALYVCERCFGPLEVAYARPGAELSVAEWRAASRRATEHLALRELHAGKQQPARSVGFARTRARPTGGIAHRMIRCRNCLADSASAMNGGVVKNVRSQPDASSRLASSRWPSTSRLRARLRDDRVRLVPGTRQLRRRHGAASWNGLLVFIPSDLEEAEGRWRTGVIRHQARRSEVQLRRCEPSAELLRLSANWSIREHQPAALLRGGLEDAGFRDRRATRLGAPDRCVVPVASGSLSRKSQRLREWREIGLLDGELPR